MRQRPSKRTFDATLLTWTEHPTDMHAITAYGRREASGAFQGRAVTEIDRGLLGERGSYRRIILTSLGLGSAALCTSVVRALFQRKNVGSDLLNGGAIPISIGIAIIFLLIGLLGRSSFRQDSDQNPTRDPSWRILGVLIAVPIAFGGFYIGRDYLRAADLLKNGVPAPAQFVRILGKDCRKSTCSVKIEYIFTPQGRSQPIDGIIEIPYSDHNGASEQYNYVITTRTVPIMYDRNDPSRAMLFWKDEIQRRGSATMALKYFTMWSAIIFAGLSPLIIGLWRIMRKRAEANPSSAA